MSLVSLSSSLLSSLSLSLASSSDVDVLTPGLRLRGLLRKGAGINARLGVRFDVGANMEEGVEGVEGTTGKGSGV